MHPVQQVAYRLGDSNEKIPELGVRICHLPGLNIIRICKPLLPFLKWCFDNSGAGRVRNGILGSLWDPRHSNPKGSPGFQDELSSCPLVDPKELGSLLWG